MEIIKNIIKLISNVGMLVYYKMNRMILEVYDSTPKQIKKPQQVVEHSYNSKHISKEDNSKHSSREDAYVPYNGPYSETPWKSFNTI